MNSAHLPHELQRFLRSCFAGAYWRAWLFADHSAISVSENAVAESVPEESALLRKMLSAADETELHAGHALFPGRGRISLGKIAMDNSVIVVATESGNSSLLRFAASLLPDQLIRWQQKERLQHLSALQSARYEEMRSTAQRQEKLIEELTRSVIETWKAAQRDNILLAEDIYGHLAGCSPAEIAAQLDEALALKSFLQPSGSIYLSAFDLQPAQQKQQSSAITTTGQRAEILLTKYEEAAERAQRHGEPVNGRTVAAFLRPPVSPPAVTDALKKHRREIARLVHSHPEKWTLVRRFLKPVRDLAERSVFD
jgi:uncharacterized coiled-coil protein SlyX